MERRKVLSPRVCIGGSLYPAPLGFEKGEVCIYSAPTGIMHREEFTSHPFGHGNWKFIIIQPPLGMKREKVHTCTPLDLEREEVCIPYKEGGLYPLPYLYLKKGRGEFLLSHLQMFLEHLVCIFWHPDHKLVTPVYVAKLRNFWDEILIYFDDITCNSLSCFYLNVPMSSLLFMCSRRVMAANLLRSSSW